MTSYWRDLPSLSALRAFDATARHGGFAAAGRVLNVTHAAVAQQVRALEMQIGVALVRRAGRSVGLTEAGQRLALVLDGGFGLISGGLEELRREQARRPLRVSTTTFIAETHVMPRLPGFWARHPGIEVAMTPSPARVDLQRDGFDLAIRAFADGWTEDPGEEIRPLVRSPELAVCAPSLLAGAKTDPQLDPQFDPRTLPWLCGPKPGWDERHLRVIDDQPQRLKLIRLGSPFLEMSAARQGLGAMLATEIICREDLEAGRLVVLPVQGLPAITYAAVLPRGPRRPAVDHFLAWLISIF